MKQVSGHGRFSNLNALSGLKQKNFLRTCNLGGLDFSVFPFSLAKSELAISVFHPLNFQLAVPNYDNLDEN